MLFSTNPSTNTSEVLNAINTSPLDATEYTVDGVGYHLVKEFIFTTNQDIKINTIKMWADAQVNSSDPSDSIRFNASVKKSNDSTLIWRGTDLDVLNTPYAPYYDDTDIKPMAYTPVLINSGDFIYVRIYAIVQILVDPATTGNIQNIQFEIDYEPLRNISQGWS